MADDMRPANRLYAPDYVSIDTLAYRLDCRVEDIEALQRSGALPKPSVIGHLRRWDFEKVRELFARSLKTPRLAINGQVAADDDPFEQGINSAIKREVR